jgi:hypothetical protein
MYFKTTLIVLTATFALTACSTPIDAPPKISMASSTANITAAGSLKLSAAASDDKGVTKVEFFQGTQKLGEDSTAPYELEKAVGMADNGSMEFTATAYDTKDQSTTSGKLSVEVQIADTIAPKVSVTTSATSFTTSGKLILTADASDDVGVTKVEFYDSSTKVSEDTSSPFEFVMPVTPSMNGPHVLMAKAFDAAGHVTSSSTVSVTVNIQDTESPKVSLAANSSSVIANGTLELTATASDNAGVAKVVFLEGSSVLGEDTSSPYTLNLAMDSSKNGTHTYTAKAFDTSNNMTLSAGVPVTVNIRDTQLPSLNISTPADNSSTSTNTVKVTGTASDNIGVTSVSYTLNGGASQAVTGTSTWEFSTALAVGQNTITVFVKDAAGNQSSSVTYVTYTPAKYALTVTSANGGVSSNPAGINCGATCSSEFVTGTQVTLTATASSGYRFKEWTGACTGSGVCTVTVNAAKSVSSTFVRATASDFDGDGKADFSDKSLAGVWSIDYAKDGFATWGSVLPTYGGIEYTPVPADYDGDGKTDLSVKATNGKWFIDYANNGFGTWDVVFCCYGDQEYFPVPADYDGDGKADLSEKATNGQWLIDYASNGFGQWDKVYCCYGNFDFIPVPADYDGDGKADISEKGTNGQWLIDYANNGFGVWDKAFNSYGGSEFVPTPADYDGDGKADLSVKSTIGQWFIDFASNGFGAWDQSFNAYGGREAIPAPADYDGDGKADIGVITTGGNFLVDVASDGFGRWNESHINYGSIHNYKFSTLSVSSANGTVTGTPGIINCGSSCIDDFMTGTQVALTANPASGYVFQSWSGACSGSGACTVSMNANASVTATFIQVTPTSALQCPAGVACSRFAPADLDRFVTNCSGAYGYDLTNCLARETGDGNLNRFWLGMNDPYGHWQCTEWAFMTVGQTFFIGGWNNGGGQGGHVTDNADGSSLAGSVMATYYDRTYDGHIAVIKQAYRDGNGRVYKVDVWDANWVRKSGTSSGTTNGSGQLGIHSIEVGGSGVYNLANYSFVKW